MVNQRYNNMIGELMELKPKEFYSFMNKVFNMYISSHKQHSDWKDMISSKIRMYREENDMSCESLARRLGVTRMQVYRWETGKCKPGNLAMDKMRNVGIL